MPKKKIINELKELVKQRGSLTKVQREYALTEEMAMMQMHLIPKPSEEKRFSHLRTLTSYIGEHSARMIIKRKTGLEPVRQTASINDRWN